MRRLNAIVFAGLLLAPTALMAQEETNEQLRRMYGDALAQMRTAQDRRNELARENETLRGRIAELEKELQLAKEQITTISDGTFRSRSQYAALDTFLEVNPLIKQQWLGFLQEHALPGPDFRGLLDSGWPFYAIR